MYTFDNTLENRENLTQIYSCNVNLLVSCQISTFKEKRITAVIIIINTSYMTI